MHLLTGFEWKSNFINRSILIYIIDTKQNILQNHTKRHDIHPLEIAYNFHFALFPFGCTFAVQF